MLIARKARRRASISGAWWRTPARASAMPAEASSRLAVRYASSRSRTFSAGDGLTGSTASPSFEGAMSEDLLSGFEVDSGRHDKGPLPGALLERGAAAEKG